MQKHTSQSKVIYKKYVCVSLWLPVAKSALPTCLLTCICGFDVICVIGGRAMSVIMCMVFVCCVREIKQ